MGRAVARRLAADGTLVVTPDLWRGDMWYGDPSPAARAKTDDFREWARGHRPAKIAADLRAVVAALRERGAERVAVVGLGLGANAVANLAAAGNKAGEEKVEASAETARETTTPEASPASSASASNGIAHIAAASRSPSEVPPHIPARPDSRTILRISPPSPRKTPAVANASNAS